MVYTSSCQREAGRRRLEAMLSQSEQIKNLERQVRELDERYTKALVEIARLRSQNQTQSETIERYRDEVSELSHGYK
jgi:hypothetical protein